MTREERCAYEKKVSQWLQSQDDISEGMELLGALPQAKVFIRYAKCYNEEAKRKEIAKLLQGSVCGVHTKVNAQPARTTAGQIPAGKPAGTGTGAAGKAAGALRQGKAAGAQRHASEGNAAGVAGCKPENVTRVVTAAGTIYDYDPDGHIVGVGGMRPNHYDEWKQMMPAILQGKIEQIEENYTQMNTWRRKLEELTADPKSSKADISRAATLTRNYEAKNLNIFAQAEVCWDELCGKTVSDEVKKELEQEEKKLEKEIQTQNETQTETQTQTQTETQTQTQTQTQAQAEAQTETQTEAQPVSADQAQKYIRDKFDPSTASKEQIQKALDYADIIMKEKGKLSKKVQAKIDAIHNS